MKFSSQDIHRSIRRYFAAALGDGWTVRMAREEIPDSSRPVLVVEPSGPTVTLSARATIPQGTITKARPFTATAYPQIEDRGRESAMEAERVADLLDGAIVLGLVEEDADIGGPLRIPVYDYDGVDFATAGPDDPYGHLRVDDHTVNTIQDPIDHWRFTVPVDLRVSWEAPGRIRPGTTVASVPGRFVPPS